MGRVIVEMRVLWVRERCREPDVGHDVVEARPERASSEGGDCVVGTVVNYEQMGCGQNTQSLRAILPTWMDTELSSAWKLALNIKRML